MAVIRWFAAGAVIGTACVPVVYGLAYLIACALPRLDTRTWDDWPPLDTTTWGNPPHALDDDIEGDRP